MATAFISKPFFPHKSSRTDVNDGASVIDTSTGFGSDGTTELYIWGGGVKGSGRSDGFQEGKDPRKAWAEPNFPLPKGFSNVGKNTKEFTIRPIRGASRKGK